MNVMSSLSKFGWPIVPLPEDYAKAPPSEQEVPTSSINYSTRQYGLIQETMVLF